MKMQNICRRKLEWLFFFVNQILLLLNRIFETIFFHLSVAWIHSFIKLSLKHSFSYLVFAMDTEAKQLNVICSLILLNMKLYTLFARIKLKE